VKMEKSSCLCTIFTQVSLCFALYLALNLGQPIYRNRRESRALDLYFISVRGGFRPLKQQTHLLKQVKLSFFFIEFFFFFLNMCILCLVDFMVWFLFFSSSCNLMFYGVLVYGKLKVFLNDAK
jgi:hypothetical protein